MLLDDSDDESDKKDNLEINEETISQDRKKEEPKVKSRKSKGKSQPVAEELAVS